VDRRALEALARAAYAEAHVDESHPDIRLLARRLLGPRAIRRVPRLVVGRATLTRIKGERCIVVARNLPPAAARFAIAHELAHWLILRSDHQTDDEERDADYLAGVLLAPRGKRRRRLPRDD